jgi:predicted ATPase
MNHPLRLRHISVSGFKSLDNFHCHFQPNMSVLIGSNGTGKSTLLQFFSLIKAFLSGEPKHFFEDRGWLPERVNFNATPLIETSLTFETAEKAQILWTFQWNMKQQINQHETLQYQQNSFTTELFSYPINSEHLSIRVGDKLIEGLRLSGSILSVLDTNRLLDEKGRTVADSVREWGQGIFSLELMNPVAMRTGRNGTSWHFGHQGQWLGHFLASLGTAQKERIVKRLKPFYPSLQALYTTQNSLGGIDLQMAEHFFSAEPIDAQHISDGYLRLIALASLPELGPQIRLILIDEIEDGIEPHILPELIDNLSQEQLPQLIMTSHSPVLVNRFEPKAVRFIARTKTGAAISAGFDEIKQIQQDFEYQGAGEIWFHTSGNLIEQWVRDAVRENEK